MDEAGPPKLANALRGLARDEIFVPPAKDQEILAAARAELEQAPELPLRRRPQPNRWQKFLPLAASIAVAALMLYFSRPTELQKTDLNRDGVIDVVDALLMAERIGAGKGRDLNRDGRVDAQDAAAIAARAVRLETGGGS